MSHGNPPDSAYPIPLTHLGCGALLFWCDEVPYPGMPFYAESVVTHDGIYPGPEDTLGACPKCGEDIAVEFVTWDGDPRTIH